MSLKDKKSYSMGMSAYRAGKSLKDNPYVSAKKMFQRAWWEKGFKEAMKADEKDTLRS